MSAQRQNSPPPQPEAAVAHQPVEVHRGPTGGWHVNVQEDTLALEVPVALVYNGISHAVMMVSPTNLEDLALGFSLSEGILAHPHECYDMELREEERGLAVHLTIATQRLVELKQRRRNLTGRTGCGGAAPKPWSKRFAPFLMSSRQRLVTRLSSAPSANCPPTSRYRLSLAPATVLPGAIYRDAFNDYARMSAATTRWTS